MLSLDGVDPGNEENFPVHEQTGDDGLGRCSEEEKVGNAAMATTLQMPQRKKKKPQPHPRPTKMYCKETCTVYSPSCSIGYYTSPESSPTSSTPPWLSRNNADNIFTFDDFAQRPMTSESNKDNDVDDDCQDACAASPVFNR